MKKSALAIIFLFLVSCSNVKDLKFTKSNQEEVISKVKNSKDLTGEEVGLLMAAMMRISLSGEGLEGKKVGALIEGQRKLLAEMNAKEQEAKRLAAEAAKKEAAMAAELSKYIVVAPFKKSFSKADFRTGTYSDTINIAFVFENKSTRDIRAFKGTTVFKDLFGEKIRDVNLNIDEGLKAGQKKNWYGELQYNEFMSEQRKFRDTDLSNMTFEWQPKAIVFADGRRLGLPEE